MNSAVELAAKQWRPHPIDVFVGNRLRLGRRMINVSQEKLAENLGVTFQQVQKYENGTTGSAPAGCTWPRILDVPVRHRCHLGDGLSRQHRGAGA